MLNLLQKLLKPKYQGAHVDTRSAEEKAKDWQATEVMAFGMPQFRAVKENEWKKYNVRNQDGSGSCVANSQAKYMEVRYTLEHARSIEFSHTPVYINRANRPQAGMGFPDAPKLQIKYGACLESYLPSQNKTDAQLDATTLPADYEMNNDHIHAENFVAVPIDFYSVANFVEQNGACVIWIISDYANWNKDIPTVGGKAVGNVRHAICAVDAVTLNGVQYLVIEDSWGKFGKYNGQRLITAEFFKDACFVAYGFLNFTYDEEQGSFEPFLVPLQFGNKGAEVKRLQDYLKSKGVFPSNQTSTGNYGNITAQAVLAFQIRYKVDNLNTLNALKGRYVGRKTLQAINNNL